MRTRIYFVRHAEASTNVDPHFKGEINSLTEKGLEQAQSLAHRCTNIPIEKIYTSKVTRAKATADEIEKVIQKEVVVLDFLKERKGSFSPTMEYIHDEPFENLKSRLEETKTFFENISHKHVVVVSHAVFLKALTSYIMLGDLFTEELSEKVSSTLTIDHTTISKFVFNKEKSKWRIESLNDHIEK